MQCWRLVFYFFCLLGELGFNFPSKVLFFSHFREAGASPFFHLVQCGPAGLEAQRDSEARDIAEKVIDMLHLCDEKRRSLLEAEARGIIGSVYLNADDLANALREHEAVGAVGVALLLLLVKISCGFSPPFFPAALMPALLTKPPLLIGFENLPRGGQRCWIKSRAGQRGPCLRPPERNGEGVCVLHEVEDRWGDNVFRPATTPIPLTPAGD